VIRIHKFKMVLINAGKWLYKILYIPLKTQDKSSFFEGSNKEGNNRDWAMLTA